MDQQSPRHEDDLSDVERRLAGWHPASAGLDADAMLFAAGQAAGRRGRGRLLWPALCAFLAVQAAGLGAWGLSERAERRALASRLRERAPAPSAPPATDVAVPPEPSYTPSPDDYFHLRRRAEQNLTRGPASLPPAAAQALAPPPPEPAILRAGQRDGLLDQ
jgi:hypothetical protein